MPIKAKILLIDDDIDFVDATRIILESKSNDVVTAYNGSDGLRLARQENPVPLSFRASSRESPATRSHPSATPILAHPI